MTEGRPRLIGACPHSSLYNIDVSLVAARSCELDGSTQADVACLPAAHLSRAGGRPGDGAVSWGDQRPTGLLHQHCQQQDEALEHELS